MEPSKFVFYFVTATALAASLRADTWTLLPDQFVFNGGTISGSFSWNGTSGTTGYYDINILTTANGTVPEILWNDSSQDAYVSNFGFNPANDRIQLLLFDTATSNVLTLFWSLPIDFASEGGNYIASLNPVPFPGHDVTPNPCPGDGCGEFVPGLVASPEPSTLLQLSLGTLVLVRLRRHLPAKSRHTS